MGERMDWSRDLQDWPLNHLSRRIAHRPHLWHVQQTGTGDTILLLHGAGASTHSWRAMIPLLAENHHVVALDLPGQGFTRPGTRSRSGLNPMTEDIAALCASQGWSPSCVIGHSAGGAIALNLARSMPGVSAVVGINPALSRFDGVAGWLFPLLARFLALNPLTSYAFSAGGRPVERARRLLESTGSRLDEDGIAYYARLISDRDHVEGTLQMMAQWNIDTMLAGLESISAPCLFLTGENDRAVAPRLAETARDRMASAQVSQLRGVGHLAHEEAPSETAARVLDWLGSFAPEAG